MGSKKVDQQFDFRELLTKALEDDLKQTATDLLKGLHPSEIADALEALPLDLRLKLWHQVDEISKGEVLLEARGDVRQQLIAGMAEDELLAALAALEVDELADLDANLPSSVMELLIDSMDTQRKDSYEAVRSYPDGTAGGLMDVDAATVRADVTLKAVLRYLRKLRRHAGKLPEHLDSLIVVDRENIYLGMLKLSDVVSLSAKTVVNDVMTRGVPSIMVHTSANKVARLFEDHDLISAPVITESGHLLGRITVDDVVDVMRGTAEHEMMSRAGLTGATDMFGPVLSSAGRRAVWLGVNLMNAFVAAWVIGVFAGSIEQIVALAVLMPIVASMGGVAGNQTLTLVTRGVALGQIGRSNISHLLRQELASGFLNGVIWAVVVAGIAIFWFDNMQLGLVFGVALMLNLIIGVLVGTLVPLGLQKIGVDPALAGGVLLVAATDVFGFCVFLGLATFFLLG